MAWRAVVISKPAKLRIQDDQLIVKQEEEISLPLEDLAALVLESPAITLSTAVLARLATHDILLLACDEKHLPCLAALPFAGHSRLPKMQRLQLDASLPFQKRCWQAIIRQKVSNQAECLRVLGLHGDELLRALLPRVTSGDAVNVESRAARGYFRCLFGDDFLRGADDACNAALNYGYAILRGAVARALAAHGLLLAQGIHHRSELNPFNLADDFLEPLRPAVDLVVNTMMDGEEEFEAAHRMTLVALLGCDVRIEEKIQSILRATEIMAASFTAACREKDPRLLVLPTILPVSLHRYE